MKETFALVDALLEKPIQYLHVSLWDFYKKYVVVQTLHNYV